MKFHAKLGMPHTDIIVCANANVLVTAHFQYFVI